MSIRCPTCYNPLFVGTDDYGEECYFCVTCDHRLSKKAVDNWFNRCHRAAQVCADADWGEK